MLSIIISSYKSHLLKDLEDNISKTIGDIQFEIIPINNPGLMGICEAYNVGARKSNYDNLLFVHEDISFHTANWGEKLCNHLQIKNTGVVGVAGGKYIPTAPASWGVANKYNYLKILQNNKEKNNPHLVNNLKTDRNQVYCLDGVFLAVTKSVYNENPFNENIKGFHGYDLDFSLRIAKKYENIVINDILIEHFSHGTPDKILFENNQIIRKKLGSSFGHYIDSEVERDAFIAYVKNHNKYFGISTKNLFKTLNFFPFGKIKLTDYFIICKQYYYFFRYKNSYNNKYFNNR